MEIGKGRGKILLFGEHSALYGYPALGLQIPHYLEVNLTDHGASHWEYPGLADEATDLIARAIDALPGIIGREIPKCKMTIAGSLPMSVGLGSSAAFCTALLRAADPVGLAVGPMRKLWQAAHTLERVFHGTASGVDTGFSLLKGSALLYPMPAGIPMVESVAMPRGWLVIGAVPREGSTSELVKRLEDRRRADPQHIEQVMKLLGSISESAGRIRARDQSVDDELIDSAALAQFGELANRAHTILSGLDLSTPGIDAALELLRDCGALGAKLSGAGGGGAFFGVFEAGPTARTCAEALSKWLESNYPLPSGPFSLTLLLR